MNISFQRRLCWSPVEGWFGKRSQSRVSQRRRESIGDLSQGRGVHSSEDSCGCASSRTRGIYRHRRACSAELVAGIVARHGRPDGLVNKVGGCAGGLALWDLETKVFDAMLSLNLRSRYALACRAAYDAEATAWIRRECGSEAALDPGAGAAAYAASKAAALALMDSLAADVKRTGVPVNAVLPSAIDTGPTGERCRMGILQHGRSLRRLHRSSYLCSDNAAGYPWCGCTGLWKQLEESLKFLSSKCPGF